MLNTGLNNFLSTGAGEPFPGFNILLVVLVLWSILWKSLALWHSARQGRPYWFVAFIILNTIGVLELVFLFGILRLKFNQLFSR
jgi:hypothetical protein